MSGFATRLPLVLCGLLYSISVLAAPGDTEFTRGVQEFRSGNYQRAIDAFEKAQQQGKQSGALYYNLGASYYRTAQYAKSEQAFRHLLRDNQFRQLAQYNLGLISLKPGKRDSAVSWFRRAADNDTDPKITALARSRLEKYAPHETARRLSGLLSLGFGHDSNVTLASTGSPTQQSDSYAEIFGFVILPAGPVNVNASLLRQDYTSVNSADFMQVRAGVQYPISAAGWSWRPGLFLARDTLAGNDFLTLTDIEIRAGRTLAQQNRLDIRLRYSDIRADNTAYTYLQGSREQFRIQHLRDSALGQLRLRYELELNDRRNLSTADYSPTRNTLQVRLVQHPAADWRILEELGWRDSRYGEAAGVKRHDKRYLLHLAADRRLGQAWHLGLRYRHSNNDSNVASETYTRNDIQIYLNRGF